MSKSLLESKKFHEEALRVVEEKIKESQIKVALLSIKRKEASISSRMQEISKFKKEIKEIQEQFGIEETKPKRIPKTTLSSIVFNILNNSEDTVTVPNILEEVKKQYSYTNEISLKTNLCLALSKLAKEKKIQRNFRGIYSKVNGVSHSENQVIEFSEISN